MSADREPGLHIDPWGRATLHTHAGTFYNLSEPGQRTTVTDVDRYLTYARDNHPEDINELLDTRLVIQAEETAA